MWKSIPGACDYYRVNEDGIIQTRFWGYWHNMTPQFNGSRYCVGLKLKDGSSKKYDIARLVYELFKEPLKAEDKVLFLDNDVSNFALPNLVSFTAQKRISKKPSGNVIVEKVDMLGNSLSSYNTMKEAALKNGVELQFVQSRCKNEVLNPFYATGYTFRWVVLD